jgi:integrase
VEGVHLQHGSLSKQFTAYRRKLGIGEDGSGRRRAVVNFHSFRRWFTSAAERAGQLENVIAAVVGHKRPGLTFGRYSSGRSMEQMRACVEAVRLPPPSWFRWIGGEDWAVRFPLGGHSQVTRGFNQRD